MNSVSTRILCLIVAVFAAFGCLSVCAEEPARITEIVSARLSEDGSTLTVSATLSDGMLSLCKGRAIYLFEFYPCDKNADLATKVPVAFQLASEELTFQLDMKDADPQRRYSKFILALQKGTEYSLMGNVVYIENPGALAQTSQEQVSAENIVGITVGGDTVSDKLGHVVVPVYINELFADTADGSIRYEYGENVYYIDTEVLARLDKEVSALSGEGTRVYLQLLLGAPDESTANLTLSLYSDMAEGKYYAPNTADPLGTRLYSSLIEFLCGRYTAEGENGRISAFILGDNVNEKANYVGAHKDAESLVSDLARTVRITDTAIRSTCAGVELYVSLSGKFAGSFDGAYAASDILRGICAEDVPFGIYLDVSASSPEFWLDEGVSADSATPLVTPKNLEFFIEYLKSEALLCGGEKRPLMLGYSADSANQDMQAASALCTIYRAMTLTDIRAVIYNAYSDEDAAGRGLFAEGMPRVAYGELCTAAEGDLITIADRIRALLGQSEYEALRGGVLSELFVVRSPLPVYNGDLPGEVNAAYLADFVDGNMYGFEPGANILTHGFTMDSSGMVLRLSAKKDTASVSRNFDGYDISDKGILVVELKPLADTQNADFTVILDGQQGGEDVSLTASVQIAAGQWSELAFDIGGIDTLSEISLSVTAPESGELTWYIKDITAFPSGEGADAVALKVALAVLIIALILFTVLLITLIYMRSRKRPAPLERRKERSHKSDAHVEAKFVPATVHISPEEPKAEPKAEPVIPVMPKTEPKTFVVPPKHTEPVKRDTMSLGIEPISADAVIDIDKTNGEDNLE